MTADRRKTRPEPEGFWRALLAKNLGLKLFSLVLGLVIFLAVRNEQEVTATVSVRLQLREPEQLVNTSDVPPEVMVRLAGTSGRLRSLDPDSLGPVILDLAAFEKGMSLMRIREEQLGIPADLKVLAISPSAVSLKLETRERKKLQVRPTVQGSAGAGFAIDRISVEPKEVVVEGPQRELRELRVVHTAPVDVADAVKDLSVTAALELPGPHCRVRNEVRPEVTIRIVPERIERTVKVAIEGGAFTASARLRGPKPVIEALDETKLRGRTESSPKSDPRTPRPVRVEGLPDGVELLEPLPTVVLPAPAKPPPPRR